MGDVEVRRWVRYGHDRLYVQDSSGARLGYWDNKVGTAHVEVEERRAEFVAALAEHGVTLPEQAEPPVVETVEADPTPVARATEALAAESPAATFIEQPWTDLATNRPGASVRERAAAERQAAPVKTVLARVLGVHTQERGWRLGGEGEEAVAARLARLPDTWRVLHSVPVGNRGSDIDHVVVGPGGVYTINAKKHPDSKIWVGGNTFVVDGQKVPYVRNARFEAHRASRLLSDRLGFPVPVLGVIAVVGATGGFTVKSQPPAGDVYVVARKQVADWLARRGSILTPDVVERVFDIARRSTTWLA